MSEENNVEIKLPENNIEIAMGEDPNSFHIYMRVKKNIRNRIKYWLFCKFFPFRVVSWYK